jgi:hypothetical protein
MVGHFQVVAYTIEVGHRVVIQCGEDRLMPFIDDGVVEGAGSSHGVIEGM